MEPRRIVEKLEHDLSHFLIGELIRSKKINRGSSEAYKYKGLNITADPRSKAVEKTIKIRIGALEAEFNIRSGEKNSGSLAPEDERLIMIWMSQSDNNFLLKQIFQNQDAKKEIAIIPFDLEEIYEKN